MEELIKVLTMIKSECIKRPCGCDGCPLYDDVVCMVGDVPFIWDVEAIEQALAKMKEGV